MTHLNFNQEFCFTVCVPIDESDSLIAALNKAKFMVQHLPAKDAPFMVEITILCQKGMNDALKAMKIINK